MRVTRIPPEAEKSPRILRGILTTIPARTREFFNKSVWLAPKVGLGLFFVGISKGKKLLKIL